MKTFKFPIYFLSVFIFLLAGCQSSKNHNLIIAKIFSDHMVLQRGMSIPVWGRADPGTMVSVSLAGQSAAAETDTTGNWMVKLPAIPAGGPFEMGISAGNKITFKDVMIGDVWFASGQSNMEFAVQSADNADKEIADAVNYPDIRLYTVPRTLSGSPRSDLTYGNWDICDSSTVKDFSAVAYFFGRQLYKEKNIAIGLVDDTWGGTPVEAWTSFQKLKTVPSYSQRVAEIEKRNIPDSVFRKDQVNDSIRWAYANTSNVGLTEQVQTPGYDDSQWAEMKVPGSINDSPIGPFNGIIWFRKTFDLPAGKYDKGLILKLGRIDLKDVTWFNGEKIGESVYNESAYRSYTIPASLVKEGKNVICIRVTDIWSVGGLIGPADSLAIVNPAAGNRTVAHLAGSWKYNEKIEPAFPEVKGYSGYPSLIFNGMVAPVIPYAIKGAIWYQGEANAGQAYLYRTLFPLMIKDWRERWGQGDFPFLFVQLPNFMVSPAQPSESAWAELREAQAMTLALPNTGMAVTIDIGDVTNIHPTHKQEVGRRLALAADKIAYGQDVVYSGPMYQSMEITGNSIHLNFDHTGSGLMVKGDSPLNGFAVAGADRKFYWANATIDGDEVIVNSSKVAKPVAVRYAWANSPDCNLYNKEGLPASPFRTDSWPGITEDSQ